MDWRGNICNERELFVRRQINNPDMRVQILKDYVKQHFPSTQLLDYALDVEKITTSKVGFITLSRQPFTN